MQSVAVRVEEMSGVAEARRAAVALARRAGFDEEQSGRVALVATEAATNMLRHAGGGEFLAAASPGGGGAALELLALDKGPGIPDVGRAMRDGYSTWGGAGTGLGAIARLASEYQIYTAEGKGAALLARFFPNGDAPQAEAPLSVGGVGVPKPGEEDCGDAWAMRRDGAGADLIVADGLGHGPDAAAASLRAVEVFNEEGGLDLDEIMARIHGALRSTRGAAVALVRLSTTGREVRFAGVGNIAGAVVADGVVKQMVSYPGTVGHELHKVRQFTYAFPRGALLLLHSDGIGTRWTLDPYPGLAGQDATLVAGVLYRDFARGRDDATVVAVRDSGAGE